MAGLGANFEYDLKKIIALSYRYDEVNRGVKEIIDEYMKKLTTIWEDCGYDKETIEQRLDAILKHNKVCT